MVAEPIKYTDVDSALREYARDNVPSVNRKVFFGIANGVSFPQIILWRIGGPDLRCTYQVDVWAPSKAQAASIAAEFATAVDAICGEHVGDTILHGVRVADLRFSPDPDSDETRYILTLVVSASAGNTAS